MGKNPFSPKYKSIWDKDIELAKMKGHKVGRFVIAYEPSFFFLAETYEPSLNCTDRNVVIWHTSRLLGKPCFNIPFLLTI